MSTDIFKISFTTNIENVLEQKFEGQWRRLSAEELQKSFLRKYCFGWCIQIPSNSIRLEVVQYLFIVVDSKFPHSQPRVFAPQAGSDFKWPHIETDGLLCLPSTKSSSAPGARIFCHLAWAYELLNYSEVTCKREFEREFLSYWGQRRHNKNQKLQILSLIKPNDGTREIVYYTDNAKNQIVFASNSTELDLWLRHRGTTVLKNEIRPTWIVRLNRPWQPSDFPECGHAVLQYLPHDLGSIILCPGRECPILIEAKTATGDVFVAVLLSSASKKDLTKGFRDISRVPYEHIKASFGSHRVQRCEVIRVDGAWVHGRGHTNEYALTSTRSIALVGCGSLGSSLVRLLVQLGIVTFKLVDHDNLSAANVSRHALGMQSLGKNKAQAMAGMLLRDFPHIQEIKTYTNRFEALTNSELEDISKVDLIISAGIDFDGDAILDTWRSNLSKPPAHVCTWTEAHAIVGHAVLLLEHDSLMKGFDDTEQVVFRLTDWPDGSGSLLSEAGCGNTFQPFAAIDLQPTVILATRLVVDFLLGNISKSCRRVWQGNLADVAKKGGIPQKDFLESQVCKEFPWV